MTIDYRAGIGFSFEGKALKKRRIYALSANQPLGGEDKVV
jgi:hypothetical protein